MLIIVALLSMKTTGLSSMTDAMARTAPQNGALPRPGAHGHAGLLFAQNEEEKLQKNEEIGLSPGRNESDSRPDKKPGKKDLPSKSAPKKLKRFVPSEKIEADQAVDFPYDI
jgi:hypothetical protein